MSGPGAPCVGVKARCSCPKILCVRFRQSRRRAPALSIAVCVVLFRRCCVGARRSLRRGPALSIRGRRRGPGLSQDSVFQVCGLASVCSGPMICVSGPGSLCRGPARLVSWPGAPCAPPIPRLSLPGAGSLCVGLTLSVAVSTGPGDPPAALLRGGPAPFGSGPGAPCVRARRSLSGIGVGPLPRLYFPGLCVVSSASVCLSRGARRPVCRGLCDGTRRGDWRYFGRTSALFVSGPGTVCGAQIAHCGSLSAPGPSAL